MSQFRHFDHHHLTTYSNLLEWLDRLPMRAAPVAQWISTINAAKGIREEEIERSELVSVLVDFDADEKLDKSSLLDFASENLNTCRIELLTERMTTFQPSLQFVAIDPDAIPQLVLSRFSGQVITHSCEHASFGYKIVGVKFEDMFGSGEGWFIFDNRWRLIPPICGFMNSLDAIDALYTAASNKFSNYVSPASLNRYERYTLLGKKTNYREWLVTLPNWRGIFNNTHFLIENAVLHIRSAVWQEPDGNPLLLVDEIQSDWHAKGRECGYLQHGEVDENSDAVPDAPFIREWHELGIKIAIWIAVHSGISRVAFTTGTQHCERSGEYDGLRILYDRHIPKSLEKLATRFDCHLGWSDISVKKPSDSISFRRGEGWILRKPASKAQAKFVKNEAVAMRYWQAGANERIEKVRTLEISRTLADVVNAKGVPLFGWWETIQPAKHKETS